MGSRPAPGVSCNDVTLISKYVAAEAEGTLVLRTPDIGNMARAEIAGMKFSANEKRPSHGAVTKQSSYFPPI